MEPMTQAAYARHRGVSKQAVHKFIAAGKIPEEAFVVRGGQRLIDPVKADFALGEARERIIIRDDADDDAFEEGGDQTFGSAAGTAAVGGAGTRYTQARTLSETYDAGIKKLRYERLQGALRPVAEIEEVHVEAAEIIKRVLADKLLRVDQIAAAAMKDGELGVRRVINEIIFAERSEIAKALADAKKAREDALAMQAAE